MQAKHIARGAGMLRGLNYFCIAIPRHIFRVAIGITFLLP